MSHLPIRKEKNCLNCGTEVIARYCHVCGQENVEPKESFWHLITHFFYDFTHFDGKFFSTLKYLIIKPGFVSAEYVRGRRAKYLHPIRMYIFTSAFFFIIFFWTVSLGDIDFNKSAFIGTDSTAWINAQKAALSNADSREDSMEILDAIEKMRLGAPFDSVRKSTPTVRFSLDSTTYNSIVEYDSIQRSLPQEKRDGWLEKKIRKREILIKQRYSGDRNQFWRAVLNNFVHQFPKLFFISLPLFALILKLLYIRRKQFYYADHAIFSIHLYIFSFIFLLILIGINKLSDNFSWAVWGWIVFALWLYWLFYIYKAMRNFYQQSRWKTILKYLLLNFAAFLTIILLFTIFFTYSVLEA